MSRRYHSVGSPPRDEDSPESHSRSCQLPPGNQSSTAGGTSWPPTVQQLDRNVALTVLRIGLSLRYCPSALSLLPRRRTCGTSPRLSFERQRHPLQSRVTTGHLRSFQAPPRNGKRVSTALPKHRPANWLASTQATLPLYGIFCPRRGFRNLIFRHPTRLHASLPPAITST